MKAMILAAGLGTRLRPLTDTRPKALVEINGRTLLEITITRLASFGVTEFIVNVHHFAGLLVQYLKSKNNFNMRIEISREDDQLLDTGGGLKKAAWFFLDDPARLDQPFLLHNVDVVSTIDLNAMLQFHKEHQALATLAVQARPSSRQLLFNDQLQLSGRRINNKNTVIPSEASNLSSPSPEARGPHSPLATSHSPLATSHSPLATSHSPLATSHSPLATSHSPLATRHSPLPPSKTSSALLPLAFSGIHILSPRLLPLLTESIPVFSIIDSYLRLSAQGQKILAFRHDHSYWRDLGKPADLAQAQLDLKRGVVQ